MARRHPPAALVLDPAHPGRRAGEWEVGPAEFRWLVRSGEALRHLFRHPSARLLVDDIEQTLSPKAVLASRLLTLGPAVIEDRHGRTASLGPRPLAGLAGRWLRDQSAVRGILSEAERQAGALEETVRAPRRAERFAPEAGVLFLRTDWCRGMVAGGSLAHLAGVLNELERRGAPVDLLTSDPIPLLRTGIAVHHVPAEARLWGRAELHQLNFNRRLLAAAAGLARAGSGRLIYQRYSIFNWTGAVLSRRLGLPFVLEFNGPEAWVAENWGHPLRYPALAARIEQANLEAADLVTVISEPLREHLLSRGIGEAKILVNPNGVDPDRVSPDLEGGPVRARLGFDGAHIVIGFIGSFGAWHGVEGLAEAFARLIERRPDLRERVRLLLIGDGMRAPAVKDILARYGRLGETVFAGLVPQAEGPGYLAACDILALPTAPNPDGSTFFGSPTKLFEYMAVGRPIVATAVGQVCEVLRERETGLLVPPLDPEAFADGLERLVDDAGLRSRLGAAARSEVVARHTWRRHVERLFERIEALPAETAGPH